MAPLPTTRKEKVHVPHASNITARSSRAAVGRAGRRAGAGRLLRHAAAPVELQAARDKLSRAERAMADKDYDQARRLAEQAQADARLAEAKAQATRSERAVNELQDSVRALNEELQRRSPPK